MQSPAEPLVTSEWLAEHSNDPDLRLIEVDVNATAYSAGHLPGAMLWNVYTDLLQPNYRIIDRDAFADLLGRSGVRPGVYVVVYGYAASLAFWMMLYYGHLDGSFLNGSRVKWIAEERPLTTDAPVVAHTQYPVSDLQAQRADVRATHDQVERLRGEADRQFYGCVGGRASQAWLVLTHILGYPRVRVYDGSWIEWGLLPGVPVET